ncbi:MAG: formate dehydrogenase accessory sulfurtransferase FdhD [Alphaproteobacteria bacterium]|nr:formate dehydrogenase accessory sulfurtransferase FdhD [Alphaproteobacteria bacterium]
MSMPDDRDTRLAVEALSHQPILAQQGIKGVLPDVNASIIPPHRLVQSVKLVRGGGQKRLPAKDALVFGELTQREVAEEIPIALVYNGISHVVLMATPQDYFDLAVGFSISEGIIADATEIMRMESRQSKLGVEIHIDILARRLHDLQQRRRNAVGATGCGLCGIESLQQLEMGVVRQKPQLVAPISVKHIFQAFSDMDQQQILNQRSHSLHAAAFANRAGEVKILREDVGRHNALDKLIGAMAQFDKGAGIAVSEGFILMTSRCSYELVRKAARIGTGLLATISAPTARALDEANAAEMGLIALARPDALQIFCHSARICD